MLLPYFQFFVHHFCQSDRKSLRSSYCNKISRRSRIERNICSEDKHHKWIKADFAWIFPWLVFIHTLRSNMSEQEKARSACRSDVDRIFVLLTIHIADDVLFCALVDFIFPWKNQSVRREEKQIICFSWIALTHWFVITFFLFIDSTAKHQNNRQKEWGWFFPISSTTFSAPEDCVSMITDLSDVFPIIIGPPEQQDSQWHLLLIIYR